MKFEHLLKIYWAKGLFYNGKLYKLDWNLKEMFNSLAGLSLKTRFNFIKRFELDSHFKNKNKTIPSLISSNVDQKKIINMYFAQITNINANVQVLKRYNTIRLYLIKSFRGRAQFLGKPSRGQRTWSNAWTAHNHNKLLRSFVSTIVKNSKIKKEVKQLNVKIVKRKLKKQYFKIKPIKKNLKKNLWF